EPPFGFAQMRAYPCRQRRKLAVSDHATRVALAHARVKTARFEGLGWGVGRGAWGVGRGAWINRNTTNAQVHGASVMSGSIQAQFGALCPTQAPSPEPQALNKCPPHSNPTLR